MLLNMSTRTYKLHNCTRAGVANQPAWALDDSPSLIDIDNHSAKEVAPLQEDFSPDAGAAAAVRLYSEVVATRPPSPRRERPLVPSVSPIEAPDRMRMPEPSVDSDISRSHEDREDDRSSRLWINQSTIQVGLGYSVSEHVVIARYRIRKPLALIKEKWSRFQQSPQTRESIIGEVGDSNWVKGILREGWRKGRLDVSSKGVECEEHVAQKTPPHLPQTMLQLDVRKWK